MKKIAGVLAALLVALNAHGVVSVDWLGVAGWYFGSDVNAGILGPVGSGKSTIAQLVYSADTNVNAALVGGLASGDDIVWSQITITESSGVQSIWADFSGPTYTDNATNFTPGYVYARIFEKNNVAVSNWYYYTTPIAITEFSSTNSYTPQLIVMNTDEINGNSINVGSNVAQVQAIPEPTTHMLFIIGGIGSWLVRSKQLAKVK